MTTAADLHAAGEFHDPASCPECNRSGPKRAFIGFDGARRIDGPASVTFIAPDGTTTVMQAESIEWEYEPDQSPEDHPLEEYYAAARDDLWTLIQPHDVTATIAIEASDPNVKALQPDPIEEMADILRGFHDGLTEALAELGQASAPKPPTTGPAPRRSKNPRFH